MKKNSKMSIVRMQGGSTPLIAFGALLIASLTARCAGNSGSDESATTGGSSGAASGSTASGGTTSGQGGSVIVTGGSTSGTCTATTVMNDCQLPPSTCDGDGVTLRYYTAPDCVLGRCSYMEQTMACPSRCYGGACASSTTTTSSTPPPPDPACVGDANRPAGAGNGGVAGNAGDAGMSGAGATTGCPTPASYCADDGQTLVYYTNPHCEGDWCTAMGNTLLCDGGCADGGCLGNRTAR